MGRKKLPPKRPEITRVVAFRYIEPDIAFELTQGIIKIFSEYLKGGKVCDYIEWRNCFDNEFDGSGLVELTFKDIKVGILFMEYPYFELYAYNDNGSFASFIINGDGEIEVSLYCVAPIFNMFNKFLPELYNQYCGAPYWEYVKHLPSSAPTWFYMVPLVEFRHHGNLPIINKIHKYIK